MRVLGVQCFWEVIPASCGWCGPRGFGNWAGF
jgi:hypothetical protein